MAPVAPNAENKPKTWSKVNKARKEEKKRKKDKKLQKTLIKTEKESVPEPPKQQELSTLSIAVPGSILENAQSWELRTYLAGQIARAACIFQVDEVVVFDDLSDVPSAKQAEIETVDGVQRARPSCVQLGRILQYLECPQYLRKHFFPIHKDLQYCGLLNPLNAPHHLTVDEKFQFREGVVTTKPVKAGSSGSIVNVGLHNDVYVDKLLTPGIRCTVKLSEPSATQKKLKGQVVSPLAPRRETGIYWGYSVRIATSLSQVFSHSPYKNGYDVTIGTSDRGTSVNEFNCPKYKHLLIMFGGLQGLEAALENDSVLNVDDPNLLFDFYLNTVPNQGSKTVRTEEAILVSLAAMGAKLQPENPPVTFQLDNNLDNNDCNVEVDELSKFD